MRRTSWPGRRRAGFTLVELLVVVVIIAIISGILFPVLARARDAARLAQERRATAHAPVPVPISPGRAAPLVGALPVVRQLRADLALRASYHQVAFDVFTRYQLEFAGELELGATSGSPGIPVLLNVPFPEQTVEARDVEVRLVSATDGSVISPRKQLLNRTGIQLLLPPIPLKAHVRFTALGRERLELRLPPADRMESVRIRLARDAQQPGVVPDEALQPTQTSANELRWEFRNLVSDRPIVLTIPAAQTPLARVILLFRLMAVAVLLFGAGFWFLSELTKPGQLHHFRWGHFLLLALTYSVFFVIFAVLEFNGGLATPVSMAVAAAGSLPLLILHVGRVINPTFAITRAAPLAVATVALVVNGVYGGLLRDYLFIGAGVVVLGLLTLVFPRWAAQREQLATERRKTRTAQFEELQLLLKGEIPQLLEAAQGRLARVETLESPNRTWRSRLEAYAERLATMTKTCSYYSDEDSHGESLSPRLDQARSLCAELQHAEPELGHLLQQAEDLAATRPLQLQTHCAACGANAFSTHFGTQNAPFCPQCGAPRAQRWDCRCGCSGWFPVHLGPITGPIHCLQCGVGLVQAPTPTPGGSGEGS